jgi:proteasome lid subunit RPN8/RPN11
VATARAGQLRSFGRRETEFSFGRVFIPSLIVDHTELLLRQAGIHGDEGFAVWAGTIAGGDAYVCSLVIPRATAGPTHGEISAETTANVLNALDERDLVPLLQLHTHPTRAWLSDTDAIRPLVAAPGFISVVISDFGYIDLADVTAWSAHEFVAPRSWRDLALEERRARLIIDDSVIHVN